MKRIDQWKAKLKAARSEAKHKERQMNAAVRSYMRTDAEVQKLEGQINDFMAKTKQ
jgi:phage host-nuclease inhibitor protein Gam